MIVEEYNLNGNGDFASEEITALRDEADIIITNPPFSIWRSFFDWIMDANKQFLIIGTLNCFTYKNVFPHIKDGRVWAGITANQIGFQLPDDAEKYDKIVDGKKYATCRNVAWCTNLEHRPNPPLQLKTTEELRALGCEFKHYDNYDAIEIPKVAWIPSDYSEERIVTLEELEKLRADGYTVEILEVISDDYEITTDVYYDYEYDIEYRTTTCIPKKHDEVQS